MNGAVSGWFDRFLGRGSASVTVPPLDGALKPNNRLEEAPAGIVMEQPDNLAVLDGAPVWSSGVGIFRAGNGGQPVQFLTGASPVTALACSASGLIAVARAAHGIAVFDRNGNELGAGLQEGSKLACVTAMDFVDDRALVVCVGSSENGVDAWQRDLLQHGRSGGLWRVELASGAATRLASGLAFPNGVRVEKDGSFIVSESWAKHLVRIDAGGRVLGQLIEDLPGYPAAISSSRRGGYWLSVFAPRSPLVEFVLRETAYRRAMMAEVAPQFWVAPALRSGVSFHEPMQGGALKQMGILKPWAPTLSYGLVIELNESFVPIRSLHSRAGGKRHGITSAIEHDGRLWLTSKGGDEIVLLDL
jgi:hypothetical protein